MAGTRIYAVAGNPALHSLSPHIFRRAFEAAGLDATYTRLAADSAEEVMEVARSIGLSGLNITSPFKEDIVPLVDEMDESAGMVGAVNTIVISDGRTLGANVDGEGVISMCAKAGFDPKGRPVVVLGAGGAAMAAALMLKMSEADVSIVNRSEERGRSAADSLGVAFVPLAKAEETIRGAEAIFACWPKSAKEFDAAFLSKHQIIFDSNYGESVFESKAREAECRYMDGREWLLGQALAVFEIFTAMQAPEEAMRSALENAHDGGKHVILTGMMGSGKNAVASELSRLMDIPQVDTDAMTESESGMTINEIFAKAGEAGFREVEAKVVTEALAGERSVIALGGGALTNPNLSRKARDSGTVIWLWASPKALAERASTGTRPLIAEGDPESKLASILEERMGSYAESSDLIISTERRSAEEAARKIYDEIRKSGKD